MATERRDDEEGYLSVSKLTTQLQDYRGSKRAERDEADEAERYYHGSHWSAEEIAELNKRRQPVITYNRCQRKIDGIVGLVERLRQDAKAYPRTPASQEGAEIATTALNYVLDTARWKDVAPDIARNASVGPVGGIELDLVAGDEGDPDITVHALDRRGFFYDPRSRKLDFSDARYMGVARWIDIDLAIEMFPEKEDILRDIALTGESQPGAEDLQSGTRSHLNTQERSIYLVEHFYIRRGRWRYCFWTGKTKLDEGDSPYPDSFGERPNGSRYIVFSGSIDQDGDRYGFIRNLKGPQDEINHRRSKGVHALNTKRLVITGGTVTDPEAIRQEYHLPDGVVVLPVGAEVNVEDNAALAAGNLEMLTEAKNEIENFGPNPALIGQGMEAKSGRAIAMLQQAGIAELGPFLIAYRAFKTRLYRTVWEMIRQNWTSQRWIRVTDDEGIASFLAVNQQRIGEDGRLEMVNNLGAVDVDLILDEGPDSTNAMADAFDTMLALQQSAPPTTPAEMKARQQIILELSSLPASVKKKIDAINAQAEQPDPAAQQMQQEAQQVEMAGAVAKVKLTEAQAMKAEADARRQAPQGDPFDPRVAEAELAERIAGIDVKQAQAEKLRADAGQSASKPALEIVRTENDQRKEANRVMLEFAKIEQQAAARQGMMEGSYARERQRPN